MAPRGWRVAAGERRVGAASVAAAPRFARRHAGVLRQAQSGTDRAPAFAGRRGWGGWSRAVACAQPQRTGTSARFHWSSPRRKPGSIGWVGTNWAPAFAGATGWERQEGLSRAVAQPANAPARFPCHSSRRKPGSIWPRCKHGGPGSFILNLSKNAGPRVYGVTRRDRPIRSGLGGLLRGELAQHVMQDAAVAGEEGPLARHCRAALPNARAAGAGGASARSAAA